MTYETERFTVSNVAQGNFKFYSLTMPSEVLAKCCYVSSRDEDPVQGFQRLLDENRAREIAAYIDSGQGSIPSAIILSAQPEAEFHVIGRGRTAEFKVHPRAFLILDGQHRVFGFSLSSLSLRVPVIIYNGLSRRDESRIFMDINSKQRGVPTELLLDIKKMAEYESDDENLLRELFDIFKEDPQSVLKGKMSPASKQTKKISRVTFNGAFKPLLAIFGDKDIYDIYTIINNYLYVFKVSFFQANGIEDQLYSSIVFRGIAGFFPEVASKVKDRYGPDYSTDNFLEILAPVSQKLNVTKFKKPGTSYKLLLTHLQDSLKTHFTI